MRSKREAAEAWLKASLEAARALVKQSGETQSSSTEPEITPRGAPQVATSVDDTVRETAGQSNNPSPDVSGILYEVTKRLETVYSQVARLKELAGENFATYAAHELFQYLDDGHRSDPNRLEAEKWLDRVVRDLELEHKTKQTAAAEELARNKQLAAAKEKITATQIRYRQGTGIYYRGVVQPDYLLLLGLTRADAENNEARKKAFRSKAREFHPDYFKLIDGTPEHKTINEIIQHINGAKDTLTDDDKRREYFDFYDNSREVDRPQEQAQPSQDAKPESSSVPAEEKADVVELKQQLDFLKQKIRSVYNTDTAQRDRGQTAKNLFVAIGRVQQYLTTAHVDNMITNTLDNNGNLTVNEVVSQQVAEELVQFVNSCRFSRVRAEVQRKPWENEGSPYQIKLNFSLGSAEGNQQDEQGARQENRQQSGEVESGQVPPEIERVINDISRATDKDIINALLSNLKGKGYHSLVTHRGGEKIVRNIDDIKKEINALDEVIDNAVRSNDRSIIQKQLNKITSIFGIRDKIERWALAEFSRRMDTDTLTRAITSLSRDNIDIVGILEVLYGLRAKDIAIPVKSKTDPNNPEYLYPGNIIGIINRMQRANDDGDYNSVNQYSEQLTRVLDIDLKVYRELRNSWPRGWGWNERSKTFPVPPRLVGRYIP